MKEGEKPHIDEGKVEPVEGIPFPRENLLQAIGTLALGDYSEADCKNPDLPAPYEEQVLMGRRLQAVLGAAPDSKGDAVEDCDALYDDLEEDEEED